MKSEVYIKDGMTRGGRLIKNSADIFLAAVFMILSTHYGYSECQEELSSRTFLISRQSCRS